MTLEYPITDRASKALATGRRLAESHNAKCYHTGWVLAGLADDINSVAGHTLSVLEAKTGTGTIQERIIRSASGHDGIPIPGNHLGGIPQSDEWQEMLSLVDNQVSKLGHSFSGCEHFLLAICNMPNSIAARIIFFLFDVDESGSSLKTISDFVLNLIRGPIDTYRDIKPKNTIHATRLGVFLYLLMRDHVTFGAIEHMVQLVSRNVDYILTDPNLAKYVEFVANKLRKDDLGKTQETISTIGCVERVEDELTKAIVDIRSVMELNKGKEKIEFGAESIAMLHDKLESAVAGLRGVCWEKEDA